MSSSGGSWWHTLTSSVEQIASDLEKTIMDTAMAAQSEIAAEQAKIKQESLALQAVAAAASAESSGLPGAVELGASSSSDLSKDPSSVPSVSAVPLWWSRLPYPWETADETRSILSDGLMQDVLTLLPFAEKNFTVEPSQPAFEPLVQQFDLTRFVSMIVRLLQLDSNLARMHAKLSPHMDEVVFWRNYFMRVAYLRAACGIDGPDAQQRGLGALPRESVLFSAADSAPAVSKPRGTAVNAPLRNTSATDAGGGLLDQISSVWSFTGLVSSGSSSSGEAPATSAWDGDAARAAELAALMQRQASVGPSEALERGNMGHEEDDIDRDDDDGEAGHRGSDEDAGDIHSAGDDDDDDLAAEILAELQDEVPPPLPSSTRSTASPSPTALSSASRKISSSMPSAPVSSGSAAVTAAGGEVDDDDDDLEAQIARELAEEGVLVASSLSGPGAGIEDDDIDLSDDDFIEVQGS